MGAVKKGDRPGRNLKFDTARVRVYLNHLSKLGRFGHSARAAGVSYGAVKDARTRSPMFKDMEAAALRIFQENCEQVAYKVAFEGVPEIRYDPKTGRKVFETTRYDSRLIQFLLSSIDPGKYRDNKHTLEHTGGVLIAPRRLDPIEWAEQEKRRMEKAHKQFELEDLSDLEDI